VPAAHLASAHDQDSSPAMWQPLCPPQSPDDGELAALVHSHGDAGPLEHGLAVGRQLCMPATLAVGCDWNPVEANCASA
jgi:hypothetical protein